MATGASNAEISDRLGLKGQAVKNHVYAIYGKLGVQTRGPQGRRDAVTIARERGVISREVVHCSEQEH
ncbi:MAG: LuxR C-terminal-related transcriptional regulator [Chloroflexota bacterium]|nr:LuxR C-terminal-related transcriptional regulator [Chloroflexota bacterium]